MKELSIEEKAKRYDEKLDVARHIYADPSVKEEDKYYLEVIFPKLEESEDERMLQEIKRYIKEQGDKPTGLPNGTAAVADMIAWLEKQGEQKPTDKVEPKFKVGDKIKLTKEPKYPAREIITIQDNAYYFDKVVRLPFSSQDEWELVEQKPAGKTVEYNPFDDFRKSDIEVNPSEFDARLNALLKEFEGLPKEELASSLTFYLNVVQNDRTYKSDEKQGEKKPATGMITPEESMGIDSDTYNKIVDECIYGEQNPADKFKNEPSYKEKLLSIFSDEELEAEINRRKHEE